MNTKLIFVVMIVLLVLIGGTWLYQQKSWELFMAPESDSDQITETETEATDAIQEIDLERLVSDQNTNPDQNTPRGSESQIGTSAGGNPIAAYHFGSGSNEVLFVGGMHGGYSWNTSLVAYELVDELTRNPGMIPDNVMVTVIPVLNPDGLKAVTNSTGRFTPNQVSNNETTRITGRFNANNVDLNRNFDCEWRAQGVWQDRSVSGGSAPFSEPESKAIRDYVQTYNPQAAVVWYSAAGGVYASNCQNGVLPETTTLTNLYARAAGYPAHQSYDYYEITGDMVNWLAKEGIAGISVLLSDHQNTEWNKNRAGIEAVLGHYAQ